MAKTKKKQITQTVYVGIDVSSNKLDVALTHNGKDMLAQEVFENNAGGIKKLYSWSKGQAGRNTSIHFCAESTGIYSEDVAEYLQTKSNTIISVVNPAQIKSFGKSLLIRTKTDAVDSKLIANYAASYKPSAMLATPEDIKEFRRLTRHLKYLTEHRANEKTKLASVKSQKIAKQIKDTIEHYTSQIAETITFIKAIIKNNERLKNNVKLLESIPSIGFKTAITILAEIHQIDTEKLDVKAEVAHAGLAPQERTSGTSIKGKTSICKHGNSYLRTSLYMPAVSAIETKSVLGLFYDRLIKKGKCEMVALTAVMKKMLSLAIGVLKSGVPFDPAWAIKKQEAYAMAR